MIKINRGFAVSVLVTAFMLLSLLSPALAQTSSDAARSLHFDEGYGTGGTFYGFLATPMGSLPRVALQRDLSDATEIMEDLSFEFELPVEHLPENLEFGCLHRIWQQA